MANQTFTVTTLADELDADLSNPNDLSLREALVLAARSPGQDRITFAGSLSGQTIHLDPDLPGPAPGHGNLYVAQDVVIDGDLDNDGTPDITLDGGGVTRILFVAAGDVTLDGLVLKDGKALGVQGGGFNSTGGGLGAGGAVFVQSGASVRLESVTFDSNAAIGGNGGSGGFTTESGRGLSGIDGGLGATFRSGALSGGMGGFGAGGGGGLGSFGASGPGETGGLGGFGAGAGGNGGAGGATADTSSIGGSGGGGGGAGLGGGLFVMDGAQVTIGGEVHWQNGAVFGGFGGAGGFPPVFIAQFGGNGWGGTGQGSGLFLQAETVTFAPEAGKTVIVADDVAGSGTAGLILAGDGTLVLGGHDTYAGPTLVQHGVLQIDGTHTSPVTVETGGTLTGSGTTGVVDIQRGGTIAAHGGPAALTTGDLSLDGGASFAVAIGGREPAEYGRVAVNGTVSLAGAQLAVTSTVELATGTAITIVTNDGSDAVNGAFRGLPEGAALTVNGQVLNITYRGGDGNDVVLQRPHTYVVTTLADEVDSTDPAATLADFSGGTGLSLREALVLAGRDLGIATITFADNLAGGTIALNPNQTQPGPGVGNLYVGHGVTIDGDLDHDGAPDIAIDGGDATRIFFIDSTDVTLRGLTLQHGRAIGGDGAQAAGGGVGAGGAIFVRAGAELHLDAVAFTANEAHGGDGGSGGHFVVSDGSSASIDPFSGAPVALSGVTVSTARDPQSLETFSSGWGLGGAGGFGAGGGGAGGFFESAPGHPGGNGGFGAGDGGDGGDAGFVAATTSLAPGGNGGGGGGAGLGGAIFLMQGATVTVGGGVSFGNGAVFGGSGGAAGAGADGGDPAAVSGIAGTDGSGIGSGLFLQDQGITFAPAAGETVTIRDDIAGTGTAGLIKTGDGTLVIVSSGNTYSGATDVNDGVLRVDGALAHASVVTVEGEGTLAGDGTVGTVAVEAGGTLSPGTGPGRLTADSIAFAADATFAVDLGGSLAGSTYDQLKVDGAVYLGGATLALTHLGGFRAATGESFTIIAATGTITGRFAEDAQVTVDGETYGITYGASEVVLTALNDAPTITAGVASNHLVEAGSAGLGVATATVSLSKADVDGTVSYDVATLLADGWRDNHDGTLDRAGLYGTATLDTAADTVTYRLDNTLADSLTASDHPTERFSIHVTDGSLSADGHADFVVDGSDDVQNAAILSIDEFAANGTFAGNASTLAGGAGPFSYALIDDAGGRFSIDANGEIHVANGLALDFEQRSTHDITVRITDAANVSMEQMLTVALNDVTPETVVGDGADNTFFGGAGNDSLDGAAGNDRLQGRGGNNTLIGGPGTDTADYSAASGGIFLDLAAGKTFTNGFGGTDTLAGIENVTGSSHGDIIASGAGDHVIDGGQGIDAIDYAGAPGAVSVDLTAGIAANGFGGHDTLAGIETALGSDFDDSLTGDAHDNALFGYGGADTMAGGAGNDIYQVDSSGDRVIENPGEGMDAVYSSIAAYTLAANVENLQLVDAAVSGTGNDLANVIEGNGADNFIDGGAAADVMIGGTGNDTYFVDNVSDRAVEVAGGGHDAVWASVSYTLAANIETLALSGAADISATGNALANVLMGNAGNNTLDGWTGADVMIGGQGNDTYFVDDAGDRVIEDAGRGGDALYARVSFLLPDNVESLHLFGSAVAGAGNSLDNTIEGNAQDNLIDGHAGADIMRGGMGNDTYVVDNAGDQVVENAGAGHDVVYAGVSHTLAADVEDLYLFGSADIDGTGNSGANALYGNGGDNVLDGGAGADMLIGGGGNDTFFFAAGQADQDTVVDFDGNGAAAGDVLMFSGYGPGATFTNVDATHWQVNYGSGQHDVIAFGNAAAIHASDVLFV